MRDGTFDLELDVQLTEDERNLRGRQAARQALAIKAKKKLIEDETEAWKLRKKALETEEEELTGALYEVSATAKTGIEMRQVPCEEVLVGVMVETRRCGGDRHGEYVSSRPANKDELAGVERPKTPKPAAGPQMIGITPAMKVAKLAKLIGGLDMKPHPEKWVVGQLAKGCPEATPDEVKSAVALAIDRGRLLEDDGKLCRAEADADEPDGGIVPDDYVPEDDEPLAH